MLKTERPWFDKRRTNLTARYKTWQDFKGNHKLANAHKALKEPQKKKTMLKLM